MLPLSKIFGIVLMAIYTWPLGAQQTNIAKKVNDFVLPCVQGGKVSLKDYPDAKGFILVFTCNHCPFARMYGDRLNALHQKFFKLGVPLLAISSTDTLQYQEDTYSNMSKAAKDRKFEYPYLYDGSQAVAKKIGADKTPHAFVIWKESGEWVVRYNGAIDDNGGEPSEVQNPYVANAVEALLEGRSIEVKETKSIGCKIYFRK
ncbi:MAG: thioredoxin family protein [Saprospiraceae bacterium]|nr:thioredoxin family protein [Saprospiraceae bacterium]